MSKEQEFRELLENQNADEKSRVWNKMEQRLDEEEIELGEVLRKKHVLSKAKITLICSFAIFIIALTVILICLFVPKKDNQIRYCVTGDYYSIETDISIEQYSKDNNLNLLYFDWYNNSEYYVDEQYKLNTSNEVICLREELLDDDGVYIIQYITDKNIRIDFLDLYLITCKNNHNISSVEVKSGISNGSTYAFFSYKSYNYYLTLEETSDEQYVLSLIEELLS